MNSQLWFAGCVWLFGAFASISSAIQAPLSITNSGGQIAISWSVAAGVWALEGSAELPPAASWGAVVPALDQTNGAVRRVVIAPEDTNRFFRLRRLDSSDPNLTGRWQLDEGTGQLAHDSSGADTTLFIEGANWTTGRIGTGALQFNGGAGASGSRSWVDNSSHQVLPAANQPFSVSFWFSPDALTTGWRGLAGTDANGSGGWNVALLTTGPGTNYLVFSGSGLGASLSVTGRTLLLPRQWYQLVVTHDGSVGNIYLDNVRLATGTGAIPAHNGPVYFGGAVGGYSSFLGRMDDIRSFTNCLTDERVSLKGEWLFDEGLGTFVDDSSGWGHHASLDDSMARVSGRLGGGLDPSGGQLIIPNEDFNVLPPSGKPFSLSFWLRRTFPGAGRFGLMSCGLEAANGWQLDLAFEESGLPTLHFGSTRFGGTLDLSASLASDVGFWSKLDVTFNGGIATAYCNGRKIGTASGAIRASRAPLVVGNVPGLASLPAVIDELRIHGRERSEWEIGPVAPVMWETALLNTTTNFPLRGSGPPGRLLIYAIVPGISPTNGTVSIAPGSAVATYVAGSRKGPDAFTYTVSDGTFTSVPTIFRVSVVEPHWLSPAGGSEATLDGSSPSRAWRAGTAKALDAIWNTNRFYDCFFYAPGLYQTRGYKYLERPTANPGCKHIGSGSVGAAKTTLRLVDIVSAWLEESIFSPLHGQQSVDDFEVHDMVLDCNAQGVPKYVVGEPVWIDIPLATPSRVDSVTLRWANSTVPGAWPSLSLGRAAAFSLCGVEMTTGIKSTNCTSLLSQGAVDSVNVGADLDSIVIQLDRRAAGVDLYGLSEIEIVGAAPSLVSATIVGSTTESRLGFTNSVLMAVDDDQGTAWASGPETQVRIELPVAPGTTVGQLNLHWNCRLIPGVGRLGPAATYRIQARDEASGLYVDVPFARHDRNAAGLEVATFGTAQSPVSVTTDRLVLLLTARESSADYYSLREVTLQNGTLPVKLRLPTALNRFHWGNYPILRAFDRDLTTEWASGSQGAVTAISLAGNNLKFTNLEVIGFGTKAGRECFPMFLAPSGGPTGRYGNVLVESCTVRLPATNNTDGLTGIVLFGSPRTPLTNTTVRRCTVEGLQPYFSYSQAMAATRVEECRVLDCSRAVYFEPDAALVDAVGQVIIRSNQFINVDYGVYLASHPGAVFDSIVCMDNEIVLSGRNGWGFAICDTCSIGPTRTTTNAVVLNNIVRYANWAPRPFTLDGGLYYSDIQHAVFGNNVVALGNPYTARVRAYPSAAIPPSPGDCDQFAPDPPLPPVYPANLDVLPPGYRRAWFANRDLSGVLLPIRFQTNGVDVLASQQQWDD